MLHDAGFSNWVTTAHKLCKEHPIGNESEIDSFLNLECEPMKRMLKKKSQENFKTTWLTDISDSEKQPKLRTYKKFKSKLQFEPYLNLHNVKIRTAIAQFRLSAHHLRIETGRHTRPYTPADKRFCLKCNDNLIQDEEHHLMLCAAFVNQRMPLLQCAAQYINGFDNLSNTDRFIQIVSSENTKLLTALGTFLIDTAKCS